MKIDVMGVGYDSLTKLEFAQRTEQMLIHGQRGYVVTPNAEIAYEAAKDEAFQDLLNGAALVLPDGAGVVLGSKILGTPVKEKVAGIEFGIEVCRVAEKLGKRVFLFGGKPGIAEQAGENLKKQFPNLMICGTRDGYFSEEQAVVDEIRQAQPDVLFVCLGAPKQERFMRDHFEELGATVMLGLGGSLDGYAGVAQRAPRWMINMNLEWLYRLAKDPKRLGRMMRLPKFVWMCVRKKGRTEKNG